MDYSQFVRLIEDDGFAGRGYLHRLITDEIIQRWLKDNEWVENPTSRCSWCQHMEEIKSGFSEEQCCLNVTGGGSCYRQTLKEVFVPFLRNILRGTYPSLNDVLHKVVHHKGPIWDGCGNMRIISILQHELGGTSMRMGAEERDR